VRSLENGVALHTIPFYGDEHPEAKKRRKRWVDFVKQKRAQSVPYLLRDSFGITAYPTVHAGELLEDEQSLSDRDKRMVRCFTSTTFLSCRFKNEMFIIPCLVKP